MNPRFRTVADYQCVYTQVNFQPLLASTNSGRDDLSVMWAPGYKMLALDWLNLDGTKLYSLDLWPWLPSVFGF